MPPKCRYIDQVARLLQHLKRLNLECNELAWLPDEFGGMSALTHLNINTNQARSRLAPQPNPNPNPNPNPPHDPNANPNQYPNPSPNPPLYTRQYRVGKTLLFLQNYDIMDMLDKIREEKILEYVIILQSFFRMLKD